MQGKRQSSAVEGKDYVLLKRFRVVDEHGFNQPVEASSFLLPANWQVNTNMQWYPTNRCIAEMLQANIEARSPDGEFELFMYPATQFDWSDDPVYLDAMQRGFNPHSCHIAQPMDAAEYITQSLAPDLGARVISANTIDAMQQHMDESAMQMTNTARQAGNNAYSHRGSAAEGRLQFNDGKEGIALCTMMQTIVTMPGTQGNMSNTYQCYVSMRMVLKYRRGNEEAGRKLLSTFLGSARINPQWATAVGKIFLNISRGAQIQIGIQIQIAHEAQEEIGNNIIRSWEARNSGASITGSSGDDTKEFSQYLRGVDSWTDGDGNSIELTSGYSNAWSKGDGTYIMTNDPSFDPNVEWNENWNRLNR